jgi:hypothetical protein
MTVYTQKEGSSAVEWCDNTNKKVKVAGVTVTNDTSINKSRYSRVHSVYDKITCDPTDTAKSFALSLEADDAFARMKQILTQYKTLDTLNQRTCCTQHWVRSFSTENGGGHAFGKTKLQNIDKAMFKHISWAPENNSLVPPVNDDPFECDPSNYLNASCEVKNLTAAEQDNYLTWAGSLELIGIPQVAIKTEDQIAKIVDDNQNAAAANSPLTDSRGKLMFLPTSMATPDFEDSKKYYSAINYTALNMEDPTDKNLMKKVFSESEFNCCIPSGQEVPDTTTAGQCCTGFKATVGTQRCCLPDFTDITVYLNRYVSSEGRGLPDTAYDPKTGYIKDPGQVQLMAAQKNLCCSGNAMIGVAVSQLSIPLPDGTFAAPNSSTTTKRFTYRDDIVDNNPETGSIGDTFDAGVRWNNHVYCVPAGFGQ